MGHSIETCKNNCDRFLDLCPFDFLIKIANNNAQITFETLLFLENNNSPS